MRHTITHELPPETLRKTLEVALRSYQARFPTAQPALRWQNPDHAEISFSAKGMALRGVLLLRPGAVTLEMDLPLVLRPFRERAVRKVEAEVQKWFDRARAGTLEP